MTTVAEGSTASVALAADQYLVASVPASGYARVRLASGAPGSPSQEYALRAPTLARTFGPYGVAATLEVAALTGSTTYTARTARPLLPAQFADNGDGTFELVDPNGDAADVGRGASSATVGRTIKRFLDLANCTIAGSNCTVVSTIDQNSPFGGPALKLVLTPTSAAASCDITITNLNIPEFNGHVTASIWIEETNRCRQLFLFHSDAGFANYTSYEYTVWNGGGIVLGGHRNLFSGPMHPGPVQTVGTGFVHGTTTLQTVRLRINAQQVGARSCNFWVRDISIAAVQRPLVAFTLDDASSSWMTRFLPYMDAYGYKATFGIYSSVLDSGALYLTSADVQSLIAYGHQVSSHNVNDYRLQTLLKTGDGERNGTGGSSLDSAGYLSEYHTTRALLEGLGADPADFCYHAWVQGGLDTQAAELMRAAGVRVARGATQDAPQVYGAQPMGNDVMALMSWPLSSSKSVAETKAAIDKAVQYGGLLIFTIHKIGDTSSDTVTLGESDLAEIVAYVAASGAEVVTMRELADRLYEMRSLDQPATTPAPPARMIARISGANMNSTADQAITLPGGQWRITQIFAAKGSVSMTTAQGGVYTDAAKSGTTIVAATQTYTTLTGATTDVETCTMAATPTVSGTIYFALTTGQGAAATADIFVFATPA